MWCRLIVVLMVQGLAVGCREPTAPPPRLVVCITDTVPSLTHEPVVEEVCF